MVIIKFAKWHPIIDFVFKYIGNRGVGFEAIGVNIYAFMFVKLDCLISLGPEKKEMKTGLRSCLYN
jgi:hypothetical protein